MPEEPNKKNSLKRIIAREGLIIVIIFISIIAVFIIPADITIKNIQRELKPDEELYEITTDAGIIEKVYEIVVTKGAIKKEEMGDWVDVNVKKFSADDKSIVKEKISFEKNKRILLMFFFLVYPLYWLTRFILWALKTVRGK